MAFKLFKTDKKVSKKPVKKEVVQVAPKNTNVTIPAMIGSVLKSFYVSEKAARLMEVNQYTFNVVPSANKHEVKKQVEKMFNVHVTKVAMLNMPKKSRNVGRFMGFKSGFKKAIVTLQKGDTIAAARA